MYELFDSFIYVGDSPYSLASDVENLNNHFLMEKDPFVIPGRGFGSLPSFGDILTIARSYQVVNRILPHVI